jgi:signal transduction histidine kinase
LSDSTTAAEPTALLSVAEDIPVVAFVADTQGPLAVLAHKLGVEDCLPRDRADVELVARSVLYAAERRRGQQARRSAREKAEQIERLRGMERLKTEFFNTAAHELGTPLTPIKIQIHLLRGSGENFTDTQRRAFDILHRNVERLSRLSGDLLDVARLQSGQLAIQKQPTDLQRVAREVVETLEPVAGAQKVRMELHAAPAAWVSADPKRVGQVLYNLLGNAIKFTPAGGRVGVEIVPTDKECLVFVHDNGMGLTPEQISRLFRPFSQVQGSLQPAGLGTGLGLYVCKGIVELHGGRIWCESGGPGHGATVVFAMPALATASAPQAAPYPANADVAAVNPPANIVVPTFTDPAQWSIPPSQTSGTP